MIAPWCSDYLDIPWKELGRNRDGADCWGLYRLVMKEQFGIELPAYDGAGYQDGEDLTEVSALIDSQLVDWREVPQGSELVGDAVLIRVMGEPIHIGMVVGPGRMLHIKPGVGASVDRYTSLNFRNRIIGFFRHRSIHD